jgi:putative ABC transport system permease protein
VSAAPDMPRLARLLLRLRPLGRRRPEVEADLRDVFTARMVAHGVRYARRRFYGDVLSLWWHPLPGAQASPRSRFDRARVVDRMRHDVRDVVRGLRRNAVVSLAAILSLGFGIGAASTAFSVIDVFYFRPLPFPSPDRLVWIAEQTPHNFDGCPRCPFLTSPSTLADWATQARSLERIAAIQGTTFRWAHGDVVESLQASGVTPQFFALLGVRPALGRGFTPDDFLTGAAPVILLSDDVWRTRLGADARVLGTRLTTEGHDVTIVGILPRDFRFRDASEVWLPLAMADVSRSRRSVTAFGRLREGFTLQAAEAEFTGLQARLAVAYPAAYRDWGIGVQPLRALLTYGRGKDRLTVMALTALVLLVGILNVSGLMLSRAMARRHEFALRSALGGSRWQIVRQLLVEGMAIGLAGGMVGVLLALALLPLASLWFSIGTTALAIAPNYRLLMFAAAVALAAGASTSMGPAILTWRGELTRALGEGFLRTTAGAVGTRDALAAVQIAIALVLATTAGLLSHDFLQVRYLDLGYDPRRLYSTTLQGTPVEANNLPLWSAAASATRERVAAVAGVTSASVEHRSAIRPSVVRPADASFEPSSSVTPVVKAVDPSYFRTFGTRLLGGRSFTATDDRRNFLVAIVNRAAATRFWPARDPVGRQVFVGDSPTNGESLTIVGMVEDAERGEEVERHWPVVYRPFAQAPAYLATAFLFVRVTNVQDAGALAAVQTAIRGTGRATGPLQSEESNVDERFLPSQVNAAAFDLFAVFGLFLATIGIYASVAYGVSRREREVGIRMALGATRRSVIGSLAGRQMRWGLGGITAGLAGALALRRVLDALLLAPAGADALLLALAGCLSAAVVFVAICLPAWRATRADAAMTLRAE